MDKTTVDVRMILLRGAAEAHGSRVFDPAEPPCTMCGCLLPARELAECDRPTCPVEGAGREYNDPSTWS